MEWLYKFPVDLSIDLRAIDSTVNNISVRFGGFFGAIKSILNVSVGAINSILNMIPWFVLVFGVGIALFWITKKISSGIIYGGLL